VRGLALLLAAALTLAACGGGDDGAARQAASADVEELENVLDLRADFEDDAGKTRMIVLLSPT
jgi:ABC-type glycerol-3-phosphate transport system substrate-binding protein